MSGLHADALAVLRAWEPPSAEQADLRARYVAHLATHPDGMRRSCMPDHVTVGALVVSPDGGHVLLNLHRKARRWFHFGGHCEDGDATLAGVAEREAREESGLTDLTVGSLPVQLSEHTVPFCAAEASVQHLDVRYLAVAPVGTAHDVSDESLDVRWWPVDDLPDLDAEMLDLIALARASLPQAGSNPAGSSSSAAADQPAR